MTSFIRRVALACLLTPACFAVQAQCITIGAVDTPLAENFDTLASTGTANTILPAGWAFLETGTGANATYAASIGSDSGGNTYSYGASAATDRAFGALQSGSVVPVLGACYTNNSGAAINALDVRYAGEQWRLGATARVDRLDFQISLDATGLANGSWVDADALDFTAPVTSGTLGARDGNAAGNRVDVAGTLSGLAIPQGATFWIRWVDLNASGADDGLGIDNFAVSAQGSGGGGLPLLRIGDTSAVEGDNGDKEFMFTLSLSAPAGPAGVQVGYATADGSATAGDDYAAVLAGSATIPAGETSVVIGVQVHGDSAQEPNETFVVDITAATGATVTDAQGLGTIVNDDLTFTAIHDIQGTGNTSPVAGTSVNTRGIVTGRKSNGFFLQARDADADADPATSEGVFVFTSTAPPAAAQIGSEVIVSGTVVEYVPAADPNQLSLTEITAPVVTLVAAGNALPTPTSLTNSFPDPAGPLDQLERVEGMRVTASAFTVVAGTAGTVSEANATATSNGQLYLVVAGTPRPFREPGIQAPDPAPGGGGIPPIPRWDFNPELLFSDTDALGAPKLDLAAGSTLANYVGPLDYGFRRYSIHRDPTVVPTVIPAAATLAARAPTADEFTVASYNVERFFDTANDPATDDPVLTPSAFANRLNKLSLGVRDYLHLPDILGVAEVENSSTLAAIADKINADAVAAGGPDPGYVGQLIEGNDVGGIDVGFLYKTQEVAAGVPRVELQFLRQLGHDVTWTQPDGTTALLNDRPPLELNVIVHFADGRRFPLTAIMVHQRSLNGAGDDTPEGDRVRRKRQKQAEFLAGEINGWQITDPERRILVMGDFNAYEFNDGLADVMGTVYGIPAADEATAVPGDGLDLVDPDLFDLYIEEPVGQRYSFEFDGNAQSLDHILVNQMFGAASGSMSLDHARINADAAEIARNDPNTAARLSDHDPAIAYFSLGSADIGIQATASPASVPIGGTMQFAATVRNDGPDTANAVGVGLAFGTPLPDLTVTAPAGWNCEPPVIDSWHTTVACVVHDLANGMSATVQLHASAPVLSNGTAVTMASSVSAATFDPDTGNNHASASVEVEAVVTDLAVAWPARASGSPRVVLSNVSDMPETEGVLTITASTPSSTTEVVAPAGWQCVEHSLPYQPLTTLCSPTEPFAPSASATFALSMPGAGETNALTVQLDAHIQSPHDANAQNDRASAITYYPDFP